jgi:hypothetical protein
MNLILLCLPAWIFDWTHGNHFSMLILIILTKMSGHYLIPISVILQYAVQFRGYLPPPLQPPTNNLKGFDKGRKSEQSPYSLNRYSPSGLCAGTTYPRHIRSPDIARCAPGVIRLHGTVCPCSNSVPSYRARWVTMTTSRNIWDFRYL